MPIRTIYTSQKLLTMVPKPDFIANLHVLMCWGTFHYDNGVFIPFNQTFVCSTIWSLALEFRLRFSFYYWNTVNAVNLTRDWHKESKIILWNKNIIFSVSPTCILAVLLYTILSNIVVEKIIHPETNSNSDYGMCSFIDYQILLFWAGGIAWPVSFTPQGCYIPMGWSSRFFWGRPRLSWGTSGAH